MTRTVVDVQVKDVEKRRYPSKHYVYVIYVSWSDGTVSVIYRRYSKFFSFQCKLLNTFTKEGGIEDPNERTIPFIPGKIFLGRSHIQRVALKRSTALNTYLKTLIKLPINISQSDLVLSFFETTQEDLKPPTKCDEDPQSANVISDPLALDQYVAVADYTKQRPSEVDLSEGMVVDVYDKKETGWWFVSTEVTQGWVPGSYLERMNGQDDDLAPSVDSQGEMYVCYKEFTASQSDEISLAKGASVLVVQKSLDGWWKIRLHNREGMAPATCLVKPESDQAKRIRQAESSLASAQTNRTHGGSNGQQKISKSKPVPPRANSIERPKPRPPRPAPPAVRKEYITLADFTDTAGDGISFKQGQTVQVMEKNVSGWWFVEIDGEQGWAPSSYLEERKLPLRPPAPNLSRPAAVSTGTKPSSNFTFGSRSPKIEKRVQDVKKPQPPRPVGPKQGGTSCAVTTAGHNEIITGGGDILVGETEGARPSVSELRKRLEQSKIS